MQTRKRTAILAKTDWLSMLDPDTLDVVLSHLRVNDIMQLRGSSRANYKIGLHVFYSRSLSTSWQADRHGVPPSTRRISIRTRSTFCRMFHSLTRLLRHTENATPLEELRNAWWAAQDQTQIAVRQYQDMIAAHRSLRQQYEDEGRDVSERDARSNLDLHPRTAVSGIDAPRTSRTVG